MQLLSDEHLERYQDRQPITLAKHWQKIKARKLDFKFYITASAVYRSAIEGNNLDMDTYLKYRDTGVNKKSKSYREMGWPHSRPKAYTFKVIRTKLILAATCEIFISRIWSPGSVWARLRKEAHMAGFEAAKARATWYYFKNPVFVLCIWALYTRPACCRSLTHLVGLPGQYFSSYLIPELNSRWFGCQFL